jgi:phosphoserine phosphatase
MCLPFFISTGLESAPSVHPGNHLEDEMHGKRVKLRSRLAKDDWSGFDFIFFDCDSTLCSIEGIDELARLKGKFDEVKRLTAAAMDGEIHLQHVYDHRLELLCPTRAEIRAVERLYRESLVPDAAATIAALQQVGKEVYIVSGGLLAAVRPFGEWLGIAPENIRAVDVRYNTLSGQWWDYQQDRWGQRPDVEFMDSEETPLVGTQGKAEVVRDLLAGRSGRAMLIGDGVSDLEARPAVELIVGFGGVVSRRRVAAEADVFIKGNSLAPVLPLAMSKAQQTTLSGPARASLDKGLDMIKARQVVFRNEG